MGLYEIGNETLDNYIGKMNQYCLGDASIKRHHLFKILRKIKAGLSGCELFYSPMYFLSIALFLNLLYTSGVIEFVDGKVVFRSEVKFTVGFSETYQNVISNEIGSKIEKDVMYFISQVNVDPKLEYYQSYNTLESLQRRYRVMSAYGDTQVKSAIFIGDDELFSVYYAAHTEGTRVVVLDIDDATLSNIRLANKKFGLNIETYSCDLIKEFPVELLDSFDVFFASGLKDYGGLFLFIYSGLLSLNTQGQKAGYITFYNYNEQDGSNLYANMQKQLIADGCYFDFWGPCDQAIIPTDVIERLFSYIQQGDFHKKYSQNKNELIELLRENNPFSADPLFPYFSIQPIQLARICKPINDSKNIERALKVLRRFHK